MPKLTASIIAAAVCLASGAAVAGSAPGPAAAAPATNRLFADSRLVTGDRISIEIVGKGPDIVLIPGLGSSRETWRATAERLRGRYRLHLVQVAGFAGEAARANATGPVVVPTAEAIGAYIVAAKLSPAVVIGHSLGGTMALWLAEHHPEHLKKLLLVDALPFFATVMMGPGATLDQVRPMAEQLRTAGPQPDAARDQMIAGMVTAPDDRARVGGWSKASDPAALDGALADDLELDLRPGLAAIPTPITLFYPDYHSPSTADARYAAAYAAAPHKTLRRIDDSLHFIMLDQPAAFAAALDAFLAN